MKTFWSPGGILYLPPCIFLLIVLQNEFFYKEKRSREKKKEKTQERDRKRVKKRDNEIERE